MNKLDVLYKTQKMKASSTYVDCNVDVKPCKTYFLSVGFSDDYMMRFDPNWVVIRGKQVFEKLTKLKHCLLSINNTVDVQTL